MDTKKILIIDDEAAARKNLAHIIENFCEGFELIGDADNALNGLKIINKLKPDIVLLDIEMPGGSGFDMLECLSNKTFEVVFITAYNQYAIKAFKYNAIDYLLKPVDIDELITALNKAKAASNQMKQPDFNSIFKEIENKSPSKIAIQTQSGTEYIDFKTIVHFEAEGSYTTLHLANSRTIMVSKPLKEYEELLADEGFLRVHNSHLINLQHVNKYQKKDGYTAIMSNNTPVPIAVRRKEIFEKLIKKILK